MELFEAIPPKLFTIFSTKNREIYVSALMTLRQAFKQETLIEKNALTLQLVNNLNNTIFNLDFEEEQEYQSEKLLKDSKSLASFIVRKLKDCGWVDIELMSESSLTEYLVLPPYSIKIINTLHEIIDGESKEYNSYMYSIYSSLQYADIEYPNYRYASIANAYEKIIQLEDELKGLFHSLKRRYTNLSYLKTINEILFEHFDSYQKEVIKQIYLPLKTKDSIARFKGSILKILLKWMRDPQIMNDIIAQACTQNRIKEIDDIKSLILTRTYFIVDKLNELDELVTLIDERNNTYVKAVTEKMSFLINSDRSIMGKMTKILEKLSFDLNSGFTDTMDICQNTFNLSFQEYLSDDSLFTRTAGIRSIESEPLGLPIEDEYSTDQMVTHFIESTANRFSNKKVLDYMEKLLENKNYICSEEIEINSYEDLIMTMFGMLKGFDYNIFYRLKIEEGTVEKFDYSIPNLSFERRRKL